LWRCIDPPLTGSIWPTPQAIDSSLRLEPKLFAKLVPARPHIAGASCAILGGRLSRPLAEKVVDPEDQTDQRNRREKGHLSARPVVALKQVVMAATEGQSE